MKSRYTLAALTALVASGMAVRAQPPTLTAANTFPMPGTTSRSYTSNTFSPGGSGASQSWDFSTQTYTADTAQNYLYCTDANTYCASYPGSNLVVSDGTAAASNTQTYYNSSATAVAVVGRRDGQVASRTYPNTRELLRFPFAYGNLYTDSWRYTGFYVGGGLSGTGFDTVSADAWGTIKTPAGTFLNVLRIKRATGQRDTLSSGFTPTVTVTRSIRYEWYDAYNRELVFAGTETYPQTGSPISRGTYYKLDPAPVTPPPPPPASVAAAYPGAAAWSIAPNPASGSAAHIRIDGVRSASLYRLVLTDLTGRALHATPEARVAAGGDLELATEGLSAGTYLVQLVADGLPQGTQRLQVLR